MSIWSYGHVMPCAKLKTLYLHLHKAFFKYSQTRHSGELGWGALTSQVTYPFDHVVTWWQWQNRNDIQLNSCNSNSCNSKNLNRTNSSVPSEFAIKLLQENSFNSNSHNSKNHLNRTNFWVSWTYFSSCNSNFGFGVNFFILRYTTVVSSDILVSELVFSSFDILL